MRVIVLIACLLAQGQVPAPREPGQGSPIGEQAPAAPDSAQVQAWLQELEASTAAGKEESSSLYQQALEALGSASQSRARSAELLDQAAAAPNVAQGIREELQAPLEKRAAIDETQTLEQLESRLTAIEAEVSAGNDQVAEWEAEAENLASAQAAVPVQLATEQLALTAALDSFAALGQVPESDPRRVLLLAQVEEHRAAAAVLQTQLDSFDALHGLLSLQRARLVRSITQAQELAGALKERVDAKRKKEANAAASQAEQNLDTIATSFPRLKDLALEIQNLAKLRSGKEGLPTRITRAQGEFKDTEDLLLEVQRRFRATLRRIRAGGVTETMGLTLRADHEWLLTLRSLGKDSEAREELLSAAQQELIGMEEKLWRFGEASTATKRLLSELGIAEPSPELRATAQELLASKRKALDDVMRDLATLTSTFYKHKEVSTQMLSEVASYRDYIEARILWIRSTSLDPRERLLGLPADLAKLSSAAAEAHLRETLWSAARGRKSFSLLSLLALLLLAGRSRLKRRLLEHAPLVRSYRTDRYSHTINALIQSLLLALPGPLLCWTIGGLLAPSDVPLTRAIGLGLQQASLAWIVLRFVSTCLVEGGVGQAHFKWPTSVLSTVRAELRWFEPLAIASSFVVFTLDRTATKVVDAKLERVATTMLETPLPDPSSAAWSESLGRLCFLVLMISLIVLSRRLLGEAGRARLLPLKGKSVTGKRLRLLTVLSFGLPAGLALTAALGYYYTALQLELRLRYSIALGLTLLLANAMLLRWLYMARRLLAVSQALDSRSRRVEEQKGPGLTESAATPIDADKVDIPAVDARTRQLFKSSITLATVMGLYLIWASVLPALQGLDRIQLLPVMTLLPPTVQAPTPRASQALAGGESNGSAATSTSSSVVPAGAQTAAPAGAQAAAPASASTPSTGGALAQSASSNQPATTLGLPQSLTLDDVLLALVLVMLVTVATRNIPALLELSLLQRLPLDSGARYATTTLVRYLILIIGVSAVSSTLGVGWQEIQWVATALTFGLAFGLQEIFANFVSGLIILLERPIRVGDIVTVGGTEGRVTQLRMRATTIQDWDRREHLVPNKEFITSSVVNWTLTDPVTRVVLLVGLAYGSDTARARALLTQIVRAHPLTLDDPKPQVVFRKFGDSSLDFEVRVFIANRDVWPELVDQLHTQIDDAFRGAQIEIAFPQRDIHVRSFPRGELLASTAPEGEAGSGPKAS